MYQALDPLLLSQLRLAIMSFLVVTQEAEFNVLKEKTSATAGNLSIQIGKLQDAGYITVEKSFRNNYPLTICRITPQGIAAFEAFFTNLKGYIDPA
jgi:DNA-binding transcriptional ArsR family regulator